MKKVESTNSRLHGICVVGGLPKDSVDLKKRVPSLSRRYGRSLALRYRFLKRRHVNSRGVTPSSGRQPDSIWTNEDSENTRTPIFPKAISHS